MITALRLLATVLTLSALAACQSPSAGPQPDVRGRSWRPVTTVEDTGGRRPALTVRLPGDSTPAHTDRVDLEQFLVAEVAYDACHWDDPVLVGVDAARVEVQLTDLQRFCVLPIPRLASFSIPWTELSDPVTIVDHTGGELRLQDRRRV